MPANLTSSDFEVLDSMEIPQQETPQTCSSPSDGNHVQNLTTALNMTTSIATVITSPAPPTNHWISKLTRSFQHAVLINNVRELQHLNAIYDGYMINEPDLFDFDRSQLFTTLEHAQQIIDSSFSPSSTPTQLSNSPPPTAGFKPPRMEIPWWSGKNYEFYTWLSACSSSFAITNCPKAARIQLIHQAMPLNKTPQFNNISDWTLFKKKLIPKFRGIPIFVRKAHSVFNIIPV